MTEKINLNPKWRKWQPGTFFFLLLYLAVYAGHLYSTDNLAVYKQIKILLFIEKSAFVVYSPLQAFLSIPLFLAGTVFSKIFLNQINENIIIHFVSLFNIVLAVLFLTLFYNFCIKIYKNIKTAKLLTVFLGLSTLFFPYSKFYFQEILTSFFIITSLYALYLFEEEQKDKYIYYFFISLLFLLLSRRDSFIILPCFFIYFLLKRIRFKYYAYMILTIALYGALMFIYYHIYAISFQSAVNAQKNYKIISNDFFTAFFGYFFSPGLSIFMYSPILIFFFVGLKSFYQKFKIYAILLFLIILGYLLLYCLFGYFSLWSLGPRYFVKIIPLLILVSGSFFINKHNFISRTIISIFFLAGIFIQTLFVLVDFNDILIELLNLLNIKKSIVYLIFELNPIRIAYYTLSGMGYDLSSLDIFWFKHSLSALFIVLFILFAVSMVFFLKEFLTKKNIISLLTAIFIMVFVYKINHILSNKINLKLTGYQQNNKIFQRETGQINFRDLNNKHYYFAKSDIKSTKKLIYQGDLYARYKGKYSFNFLCLGDIKVYIDDELVLSEHTERIRNLIIEKDFNKVYHKIKIEYNFKNRGFLSLYTQNPYHYIHPGF